MKILCTADIHIGRRAARLPETAPRERFSTAAAWADIVEFCIEEEVDLLLCAGDIVDRDNRFFEAYSSLERGLTRLGEHDIHTCCVAGNHDFDVLKKLFAALKHPDLTLLGSAGGWERKEIATRGGRVIVDGWSFPHQYVRDNPLAAYPPGGPEPDPALPRIGMIHGDLDQPDSRYAPLNSADLACPGVSLWLLGHIHKPFLKTLASGAHVLYPGSPLALDPSETGLHGPWLIELPDGTSDLPAPRQVPRSQVRYEQIEVPLSGIDHPEAFEQSVPGLIKDLLNDVITDADPLQYIVTRVLFTGQTRLHAELPALSDRLRDQLALSINNAQVVIDTVTFETAPHADLAKLARGSSAASLLAALLRSLDDGAQTEKGDALFHAIAESMKQVHRSSTYTAIREDPPPTAEERRALLRQCGLSLLASLTQQGGGDG